MPRGPAGPAAQLGLGPRGAWGGREEGGKAPSRLQPASVRVRIRVRVAAFHLKKKKKSPAAASQATLVASPERPLLSRTRVLIRVFIPARPLLGPCLLSGLETRTATCLPVRAALQWLAG